MMTLRIQNGEIERLRITALDSNGNFITGLGSTSGTLYPTIEIRRKSDGYYLDFNDNTFKSSGWTIKENNMSELDSVNSPGVYYYDFNTSGFSDDEYFIRVTNSTASNSPFEGELKVGGFIDNIDIAISSRSPENEYDTILTNIKTETDKIQTIDDNVDSILVDTNEIQTKLPTNNIMGSSDKSDKDDEIDAIKLKTDNLPSDPAGQSAVESAIDNAESNIRGVDNDDLKNISDQIDIVQSDLDNVDQYKADISSLATEAQATTNKNDIISEVNVNETKIDSIITTLSTIVSDIWSYTSRSLTSFGTLITDMWTATTRTLTGIGGSGIASESNATTNTSNIISEIDTNESKIDIIDTNVDSIKATVDSTIYGLSALKDLIDAIDNSTESQSRFDEIKGSGWTDETLQSIKIAIDNIVNNTDWSDTEKNQIRDALGIDGTKVTSQSGKLQDIKTETDKISSIETLIKRILGLSQENFRIVNPVYNSNHLLTSATIKIYNNASDCDLDVNALATYSIVSTYNVNKEMQTYKVIKN